jgi:type I restriction enzyme R subunit
MNEAKIRAEHSDLFDVLAYVAFTLAPHTRTERAAMAKTQMQQQFTDKQQAFVEFVIAHYVKEGVEALEAEKLTPLLRIRYNNAIADALDDLGSADRIRKVFVGFQRYLYQSDGNAHNLNRS